jgi:hypothetical protein
MVRSGLIPDAEKRLAGTYSTRAGKELRRWAASEHGSRISVKVPNRDEGVLLALSEGRLASAKLESEPETERGRDAAAKMCVCVSDRDAGGVEAGEPARVGARFASGDELGESYGVNVDAHVLRRLPQHPEAAGCLKDPRRNFRRTGSRWCQVCHGSVPAGGSLQSGILIRPGAFRGRTALNAAWAADSALTAATG